MDDNSRHHGIDNIILKSQQSVNIVVVLIPLFVCDYDGTSPRHGRTSLFKISLKLCVTYSLPTITGGNDDIKVSDFSSERINESIININSTLCTPILHIDEKEIDFDSCILNNTYIRLLSPLSLFRAMYLYSVTYSGTFSCGIDPSVRYTPRSTTCQMVLMTPFAH